MEHREPSSYQVRSTLAYSANSVSIVCQVECLLGHAYGRFKIVILKDLSLHLMQFFMQI